jgi:YspA, cpYpsA-related SLOG family
MRVLVCGGRDFHDAGLMNSVLDRLHTEKFFTVLIQGNARGADRIADAWASCRGIDLGSDGGGDGSPSRGAPTLAGQDDNLLTDSRQRVSGPNPFPPRV